MSEMSEMIDRVSLALTQTFHECGRVFDDGQAEDLARAAVKAMEDDSDIYAGREFW